ncbi:MAG: FCD domain-containing protein [Amaricoccus sp.]|uniref:FCD domain-containing protein n=1 Tax=Amaricoccus sp. TaxID=1872485 RepID=UPI0039E2A83B
MTEIKGGSAAEQVARHMEDLIREGSLRPGVQLLAERELATRLSVSRPTLRQGIKLLEEKGLLESHAGGATVVAPLGTSITDPLITLMSERPIETIDDYLEFRATVERMAAALAAERGNDVDRAALTACMERIDRAHAPADAALEAEADVDLHVTVYESSHNIVLLQIMRALAGMLRTGVFYNRDRLYSRPEVRDVLRDQHRDIVEAILARDPEAAGEAAAAHMFYTRHALREIHAAEARLEISLRRIDGGNLSAPRR